MLQVILLYICTRCKANMPPPGQQQFDFEALYIWEFNLWCVENVKVGKMKALVVPQLVTSYNSLSVHHPFEVLPSSY